MLYFSIENAPGEREKYPRLQGGLRTDGFVLGGHFLLSYFSYAYTKDI